MRNSIAGAMALLGTLLVLAGGTVIVLKALRPDQTGDPAHGDGTTLPLTTRMVNAARSMPAPDRLIGWGIVLLVLGAVAAGAISFNFGANAGTR